MIGSRLALFAALASGGCGDTADSIPKPPAAMPSGSPAGGSSPSSVLNGLGGMPPSPGSGGVGGQIVSTSVGGSASGGGPGSPTSTKVEEHALVVTPAGGCALDAKGAIQCWGGKFAAGAAPSGKFLHLASYGEAVCGIREDRVLLCFAEPGDSVPSLPTAAIEGVSAVGVDSSEIYWLDESGKASMGLSRSSFIVFAPPPESERFSHVTAGFRFGCGLRKTDATIACWNALAEPAPTSPDCATGDEIGQRDAPSGMFSDMSTYAWTTCAVRNAGELACWGAGKGPNPVKTYPCDAKSTTTEAVPPPGKFKRVAMGLHYGCAEAEDGHVECWGNGTADTCVVGSVECRQARPPAGTFDQVAVGTFHSCAMTTARKITCWGYPGPDGGDGRTVPPGEFQ